jgi:biotin operon repressor
MRKKWSKEIIIQCIHDRHLSGKPLNHGAVIVDDEPLASAAIRYFGGWNNALTEAGYNPADVIQYPRRSRYIEPDEINTHIISHLQLLVALVNDDEIIARELAVKLKCTQRSIERRIRRLRIIGFDIRYRRPSRTKPAGYEVRLTPKFKELLSNI